MNPEQVLCLQRTLNRLGITDFIDSFDPAANPREAFETLKNQLNSEHQLLFRFLELGEPIPYTALSNHRIKQTVNALRSVGFVVNHPFGLSLGGLALNRVMGIWLLSEVRHAGMTLYFGGDSISLLRRLQPIQGGKALDLCSGPGIQSLYLATGGMDVTAVDVNPFALSLCQTNAQLNRIDSRISIIQSNLYENVSPNLKYDLIVANPPLLPIPKDIPYPFIGDGGQTGLDVTLRIIEGASNYLGNDGQLLIIGMTLSNSVSQPEIEKMVNTVRACNLSCCITITNTYPLSSDSSWIKSVAMTSMNYSAARFSDFDSAIRATLSGYTRLHCDAVCTFFLRAWPTNQSGCAYDECHIWDISSWETSSNPWMI